MSNADINTAVSNQFLRVLFTIIIPGIIPASIAVIYLGIFLEDNLFESLAFDKKYILLAILIVATLIIGYLIEIFGVWLEAKYIDAIISSQEKYKDFDSVWEEYLKIDSEATKSIILVQYYRTILTKFKFLINLPVALWVSFGIIFLIEFVIKLSDLKSHLQNSCCFLLCFIILNLIASYYLFKRSLYCAKLLHESRKHILEIVKERKIAI